MSVCLFLFFFSCVRHNNVYTITQTGSQVWSGDVHVWAESDEYENHGRREPLDEALVDQWAIGDKLQLKECVDFYETGKYIYNYY